MAKLAVDLKDINETVEVIYDARRDAEHKQNAAEQAAKEIFRAYAKAKKGNKGIWTVAREVYMPLLKDIFGWKNERAAYYHAQKFYQTGNWALTGPEFVVEATEALKDVEPLPAVEELPLTEVDSRTTQRLVGFEQADREIVRGMEAHALGLEDELEQANNRIGELEGYQDFLHKKNAGLERSNLLIRNQLTRERGIRNTMVREMAQYPEDLVSSIFDYMQRPEVRSIVGGLTAATPIAHPGNLPAVSPEHSESAICLLSDLHFSEVTRKEDTCGFFPYNTRVAAQRLWEVLDGYLQALRIQASVFKLNKIYLAMLGDMISGSIHKELVLTNDLTDQAAMVFGYSILKRFTMELLQFGVPVHVIFTCGNHPRTTERMPNKAQALTNQDWVIYEMLKESFRDCEAAKQGMLTWEEKISPFVFVDVEGWRHCFAHGTEVAFSNDPKKYSDGIYGFIKAIRGLFDSPFYRAATGHQGTTFDRFVCGNTHTPISMNLAEVNGSLTGQNELGTNWALEPINAVQKIWGVSKKRRRTFGYDIDVTEVTEPTGGESSFADFAIEFTNRYGRVPYGRK